MAPAIPGWALALIRALFRRGDAHAVVSTTKCSKLIYYCSVLQELDPSVVADVTTCMLQYQELDPNVVAGL